MYVLCRYYAQVLRSVDIYINFGKQMLSSLKLANNSMFGCHSGLRPQSQDLEFRQIIYRLYILYIDLESAVQVQIPN